MRIKLRKSWGAFLSSVEILLAFRSGRRARWGYGSRRRRFIYMEEQPYLSIDYRFDGK